ncbi:MAG: AAA family ATPase [Sphaerochaetaceae bacterium]|nr:AAA family ATPase [Sphaerochaetaceae bacterium]
MQYGLIGERLSHSYSKELHNQIGDYDYCLKEIARDQVQSFMLAKDFKAINVTIPYKETVIPYLDYIDDFAKDIGAVNTVVNKDGKLFGYNTDFFGLRSLVLNCGIDAKDKKVLILGTGGTCKTARAVFKDLKAKSIIIVSRKKSETTVTYEEALSCHADAQIIVNATPCGMYPNLEDMPIEIEPFKSLEAIVDVIYNPLRTRLVLEAQKRGLKACGGLFMLSQQAIAASEFFFDKSLDASISNKVYKKLLNQKQNIVLIGMPGSGKSTIGQAIANKLGYEFIDTDQEIIKSQGKTPSEIIKEQGEKAFRDIESEVCKNLATKTHAVIATGGGAILRAENVTHLKNNGFLFFIDRKLETIRPSDDRPLTDSLDKLKAIYEKRYPIYTSCADSIIVNNDIETTVKTIIGELYEDCID